MKVYIYIIILFLAISTNASNIITSNNNDPSTFHLQYVTVSHSWPDYHNALLIRTVDGCDDEFYVNCKKNPHLVSLVHKLYLIPNSKIEISYDKTESMKLGRFYPITNIKFRAN